MLRSPAWSSGLLLLLVAAWFVQAPRQASAILLTPFGANGEGGSVNGQLFALGSGGQVFELDAFLNLPGFDLNGATSGTSAQLSVGALPAALDYSFSAAISADLTDVTLTYLFENHTGATLAGVTFLSFLDAEVVETANTFFNEFAVVTGSAAPGQGFEVDEPGFVFGDIFDHLLAGALDDTNALPASSPDDVSMALSFALGDLLDGFSAAIDIQISEDGDALPGLALSQLDPQNPTVITYSGRATVVPEPSTGLLAMTGLAALGLALSRRGRRCSGSCS